MTAADFGQDGALHYIVMELGGGDLQGELERRGALPLDEAARIGLAVARALAYAHERGVIHRDLKPGNILFGVPEAAGQQELAIKVMDFGLARLPGAGTLTVAGARVGTPQYMSPEQALGRVADERSDLYALGVLLYELVTGVRPFDGDDAAAILQQHLHLEPVPPLIFRSELPGEWEGLNLRLLEKDPAGLPVISGTPGAEHPTRQTLRQIETGDPGG